MVSALFLLTRRTSQCFGHPQAWHKRMVMGAVVACCEFGSVGKRLKTHELLAAKRNQQSFCYRGELNSIYKTHTNRRTSIADVFPSHYPCYRLLHFRDFSVADPKPTPPKRTCRRQSTFRNPSQDSAVRATYPRLPAPHRVPSGQPLTFREAIPCPST